MFMFKILSNVVVTYSVVSKCVNMFVFLNIDEATMVNGSSLGPLLANIKKNKILLYHNIYRVGHELRTKSKLILHVQLLSVFHKL